MNKQLYRSDNNRMFMGVCAGIGEYFNIDPIVRLLFMILCFIYGGGFFVYLFAAIIIPKREY